MQTDESHENMPEDLPKAEAPMNAVPPAILALVVIIMGVELVLMAGEAELIGGMTGPTWRVSYLEKFAFFDPLFTWMVDNQVMRPKYLMRFVTYPLIQPQFLIAVIVSVFLLALGRMMARAMTQWGVLAVFFGASIIGALVFAFSWETKVPLFSGLTGAYGLVGGYTFLIWRHLKRTGGRQINAFALIGVLLIAQLGMGLLFGEGKSWVSEISGFISGFFLTLLLVPGTVSGWIAKARERR